VSADYGKADGVECTERHLVHVVPTKPVSRMTTAPDWASVATCGMTVSPCTDDFTR